MIPPPDLLAHLRTLPGRCWYCGAYEMLQGHDPACPRPFTARDQHASWLLRGGRYVR